jgi:hypothetical protein
VQKELTWNGQKRRVSVRERELRKEVLKRTLTAHAYRSSEL